MRVEASLDDKHVRNVALDLFRAESTVISVSIVSHAHGAMVIRLVSSLLTCPEVVQIIVTRNVPEVLALPADSRILVIDNSSPRGFGVNHNAAFQHCRQPFFCPLNPDIELIANPFPQLLALFESDESVALTAPMVRSLDGAQEDSVRHFPTVTSLLRKALSGADGRYSVSPGQASFSPEWVAGMFMLFSSRNFVRLGGFDERFFLYYEDVDICVRAWNAGMRVLVCPSVFVIHDARRDSHRSLRHLRWHLTSMARYFFRHWGRLPRLPDQRSSTASFSGGEK